MKKELTPNEILFDLSIPEDDEFKRYTRDTGI